MDEGALIRARTFEGARKATLALVAPLDDAVMEEPLDPIRDAAACAEPPDRPVPGPGPDVHVAGDLAAAGMELVDWFTDEDDLFALSLARPAT